jgi:predicted TIM-barrel fold metal-dependent hydrolase
MIIDAHYHLEERIETVDRLLEQMERHGIDRIALMPALNEPFTIGKSIEVISGLMRKALIGRWHSLGLRMYSMNVTADGKFSLLFKCYPIYDEPSNESVASIMRAHPDKFYGWIAVNPRVANASAEVEKWIGKPGWIGVKTHPFMHRCPVAMYDNVAAFCSEKGLPILMHLGPDRERGDYRYLPERHPKLKIIYPHAGIPFYKELWEYAKNKENVYVDLSSPYLNEPLRLSTVKDLGAQKCLYGSDGPYGYPDTDGSYDHGWILKEILRLPISDTDKELILAGNFKEITHF